jgi:TrmH family RNA methyltransferase
MKENPQGIAAVLQQRWHSLEDAALHKENSLWIALDSIQNPGNLGTILRTGDAFGAQGILLLDHSTDPYDPTALRSSMGSVFSQRLVRLTLKELEIFLQAHLVTMVGASGASPVDYFQVHYPAGLILLMGSEREGLTEKHLQLCDYSVRIPMVGRSDSLNVSVAAAVILAEISKQRILSR